jgi:heme/copper-type cytochrome/quinol oxidase subunit 2
MDNILKNPTFIAVITGTITYTFLNWKSKQNKKKDKKNKMNNNVHFDNIMITLIVSIIVWLFVYAYINHNNIKSNNKQQNIPTYKLVRDVSESPKSFTMINPTGGIVYPLGAQNMPDIFIDQF